MSQKYYSLEELFDLIEEPNRTACIKIYTENKHIFDTSKGSKTKHQAWEGGYLDHIRDVMNIAIQLYATLDRLRPLQFTLSDALLVLYLHDLEKPWKYAGDDSQKAEVQSFSDYKDFIRQKALEYGFQLTTDHQNVIEYVHGEGDDYDPFRNVQTPLAAFVHCCDTMSARIWHEFPKNSDSW